MQFDVIVSMLTQTISLAQSEKFETIYKATFLFICLYKRSILSAYQKAYLAHIHCLQKGHKTQQSTVNQTVIILLSLLYR